jgi:hypothetical protein
LANGPINGTVDVAATIEWKTVQRLAPPLGCDRLGSLVAAGRHEPAVRVAFLVTCRSVVAGVRR